jgi:hypothetical protein
MADEKHSNLIKVAVTIARERSNLLSRIRALLETGNELAALKLMKEYCGMTNGEKSNRPN